MAAAKCLANEISSAASQLDARAGRLGMAVYRGELANTLPDRVAAQAALPPNPQS
jgi:hypothetical protein